MQPFSTSENGLSADNNEWPLYKISSAGSVRLFEKTDKAPLLK